MPIKIVLGRWFRLPRLGPDVFREATRDMRLRYESKSGFMVTEDTDLKGLVSLLERTLGEKVEIQVPCFICGGLADCEGCSYSDVCDRSSVSRACVCYLHYSSREAIEEYTKRFLEEFERKAKG